MDEARSLTYSINVEANTSQAEASIRNITSNLGGLGGSTINIDADTSQAESNIRNVTSSLGGVQTQARSVGSAFRSSFLDGIDSGNSFSSSLRSGVGGAFSYVTGQAKGFVSSVASSASEIGNKFAHPISTIKNGLGNAIQNAKSRFIEMARSAQQAENATGELGDAAGEARRNVSELGDAADDSGGKLSKFGGILKGAGAAIGAVSAAAAAGAVAIGKAVVSAYAEYEQLVGGVDTLFKDASGKHNLLRIKRAIARYRKRRRLKKRILAGAAASLLSRLGQLKHCNNHNLYRMLFQGERLMRELKRIIRQKQRKEELTWNTYLERRAKSKSSKLKAIPTPT